MPKLEIYLFESPRIVYAGVPVDLGRRQAVALLAYLAVTGRRHNREALTALFWPEFDRNRGRAALRRNLSALTTALAGPWWDIDREAIGLRAGPQLWIDVTRFGELLAACQRHEHPASTTCSACVDALTTAVSLYRDDLLAGFGVRASPEFDDWRLFHAEELQRQLAGALEQLALAHIARAMPEPALAYGRRMLALDPLHEPAHRLLMRVYAWAGQRAAALRQYAACVQVLDREVGVAPELETTELHAAIKANRIPPLPTGMESFEASHVDEQQDAAELDLASSYRRLPARKQQGSTRTRSHVPPAAIAHGRFVGRERDVAVADLVWRQVAQGNRHVLLVSGDPGIGKSRLLEELAGRFSGLGARVLVGSCFAEGGAPYAPITQILRRLLDDEPHAVEDLDLPADVLAGLLMLAPALRRRFPAGLDHPAQAGTVAQDQLVESLVTLCTVLAAAAPLVICVEDIHWADQSTLALLRHLARSMGGRRLLLVLTHRPAEPGHSEALDDVLLDLQRERLATQLRLTPLDRSETRELVASVLGGTTPIGAAVLDEVHRTTEGNPFFVEELCKALLDQGKLSIRGGQWQWSGPEPFALPWTIRRAILARVNRLSLPAQDILRLAAILGRTFEVATLRAMSGWDDERLATVLDDAERMQLLGGVQRGGRITITFGHALIPFTLRESLSALRRQLLHRQATRAIEATRPGDVEALAYHFTAAGERDQAIAYAWRAARRAEALYAYETALQHLQTILSLIEPDDRGEQRLAVLEQAADLQRLADRLSEAVQLYQEALEVWSSLPEADTLARVRLLRKLGETVFGTELFRERQHVAPVARDALHEGMRLMAGRPPHAETVRLLVALAHETWRTRVPQDWDAGEHYARTAVELAEQLDAPELLSAALDALAVVYAPRGLFRERVDLVLRRLALSGGPGTGDQHGQVHLLNEAGAALVDVGRYAEALPYLYQAEQLASQIRARAELVYTFRLQALCAFRLDRWDEVAMEEKFRRWNHAHPEVHLEPQCFHLALVAAVTALRGDATQAAVLRSDAVAMMARDVPPDYWGRPGEF